MARIFIKTYGCTHNVADSERMAGLLEQAGHSIVDEKAAAELVLVNSCTVKDPAEKRFWHDVELTQSAGQQLVVAGCVPQSQPRNERLQGVPTVGVKEIARVVEVVEAALDGTAVRATSHRRQDRLDLPRARRNPHIEIVPINDGCLGSCTYCATVQARGRLRSHSREDIVNAIRAATREGVKEIWMTSEDVGAWGQDIDEKLPNLLRDIAAIPGDFMVRVGMANPPFMKQYVDELIALFRAHPERFFHFLHLPVQSGSDRVLQAMNREYTVAEFRAVAEPLKEAFPDMTLMTDYIVGFPGETDEEFQETLALARKRHCRILNINKFYPRPHTPAARLRHTPTKTVAARCKELVAWYESEDPNVELLGTTQRVLFTERGKGGTGIVGHNRDYVQVVLPDGDASLLGSWQRVRIVAENKYYLTGAL